MNNKCTQCGFDNDPTRVFCQNCGTRIEAPAAAGAAPDRGKLFIPQGQQAPPGVRKPIKPVNVSAQRGTTRRSRSLLGGIISTLLSAALIAAVIQMARTPDNIPAPVVAVDKQAGELYATVSSAAESPYPRNLGISAQQANNYLAARILPPVAGEGGGIQARFSRAFVTLDSGFYRVTVEQKLGGWPLYISLLQKPVVSGSALTVENIGGGVGRLPIHPKLLPLLERLIASVTDSLSDATQLFGSANAVSVQPSLVIFNWPGTAAKKP